MGYNFSVNVIKMVCTWSRVHCFSNSKILGANAMT